VKRFRAILSTCWLGCLLGFSPPATAQKSGLASSVASTQKPELVVQTGHSGKLRSLAFSPDGRTLASGGEDYARYDYTIKLWDATNGRELRALAGHDSEILSVAFSPDGRTLASGSADTTIRLWDVASGRQLRTITGHQVAVRSVAFSPDGRMLASAGDTIRLWDVASGGELQTLARDDFGIESIAFSPDGRTLASASHTKAAELWDVASGRRLRTLEVSPEQNTDTHFVAFSPDGRTLATLSAKNNIKVWDVATGRGLRSLQQESPYSVVFSSDGQTLASAGRDKLKVWDATTGRTLFTLDEAAEGPVVFSPNGHMLASGAYGNAIKLWDLESRTVAGHTDTILSVALSPDGRQLATAYADQSIALWDLANGHQVETFSSDDELKSAAFSPDGRTLVGSGGFKIHFWDVATGKETRTFDDWSRAVAFSPDGSKLASGGMRSLKLWDVTSGNEIQTLDATIDVTAVAFSPDGKALVSAGAGAIQLWDLTTGKKLGTRPANRVDSVAFSPDGNTLVSAGEKVQLWNVADGSELRTLPGPTDEVLCIAFSPDGRILAGGNADATIELWEVASGRRLQTFGERREPAYSVAFSSDKKTLVSGSDTIRLWDIASGRQLQTLARKDSLLANVEERQTSPGPSPHVNAVALSPDGRILASVDNRPTITLSDLASGKELRTLKGNNSEVKLLAFSPDGTTLASQGYTTELWDVATGQSLRELKRQGGPTESIVFSPDGRILATGGFGTINLWNVADGEEPRILEGDSFDGRSVAFAPDGKTLASAGSGKIKLWDVKGGRVLRTLGEDSATTDLVFSPDGSTLASRGQDIKLWNLRNGSVLRTFHGPTGAVLSVAFSHDGRILACGQADATIELWDVANGRQLRTLGTRRESVYSVTFSSGGRTLVSGDSTINFWDIASGRQTQNLTRRDFPVASERERQTLAGYTAQANSVVLSPDGRKLATGIADHKIQIWDLVGGREPRTLTSPSSEAVHIAFSPDGNTLAVIDGSTLRFWDADTGRELPSPALQESQPAFQSIAFSPDGQILALGGNTIGLWDLANGRNLTALAGHTGKAQQSSTPAETFTLIGPNDKNGRRVVEWHWNIKHMEGSVDERQASVISMAFSSDGHTLATGSDDLTIKLWDLASGHELRTLEGHSAWVRSVAFSPDGRTLASASDDLTVKLWDVGSGRALRTMEGHTNRVMSVAFSPNDHILASGSDDGTIILWDADSGRILRKLPARAAVLSVAFRPDGRTLTSGDKHAVRLWDVATGGELVSLFTLDQGNHWLIVNPDGFFDTDNLDEIDGLSWVFPDEPLRALPLEIFMRDYFKPRLLPQLLEGRPLPDVRPLHDLNRAQPQVDLVTIEPEAGDGLVSVTVQVSSTEAPVQRDKTGKLLESGAYDLRLFRDGQVVAQWPEAKTSPISLQVSSQTNREAWQNLHRIDLIDGRYTHTFSHIRLPQRPGVDRAEFTAYAFNSDRVKSRTTAPYEYSLATTSPTAVSGRAYLVTVAVSANQSHNLDLELAVSSAERARSLLRAKLQSSYQEVLEVPLYSDFERDSNRLRSKSASKANLKSVLDLLAGRSVDPILRDEVDPKHQLQAAGPDDAIVLYFVGHGYADPQGKFYLMPYDTGSNWGITADVLTRCQIHPDQSAACKQAQDLLGHLISSSDLAIWWNGVDAGDMAMILDSCHSGAAPGKEFRPGPLGDPGLGQLSYDKGMQILSASQPAQSEKGEWVTGGEGRTLLVDALEAVAKENPQQGLEQWLHGVEEQLPRTFKQLYPGLKDEDVQVPVLLDFAKKLSIVASKAE
jgi:WD40 repeat protein